MSIPLLLFLRVGLEPLAFETTKIVNCVSLRSSPVLSLCVGSSYHCDGNHCCSFFDRSVCVCGMVLCHVVVVMVFVRVCLVWCVRSVVSCLRVFEACELHERSPCAPNFVERTPDGTTSSKK